MRIAVILLGATLTSALVAPLNRRTGNSSQSNPAPITSTLDGFWFDVEVKFGDQSFFLLVDTGSSDTWVAKTGYTCIEHETNLEIPAEKCGWSPTYDPPSSLEYVSNQTFGVQYGTGIGLGKVAISDVTLGGITVKNQKVGIVDHTNDKADGINSGILGLGFPPLTSAHNGSDNKNDSLSLLTNRAIYDPLFVSMYKQNLSEPWYSVALERMPRNTTKGAGGWLGLGELPPVKYTDDWAVAPIEITETIPDQFYQRGGPEITLMTLTVDSVSWGPSSNASHSTNSTKFQAVVDTGNNRNQLPAEIVASIHSQFEPTPTLDKDAGAYKVDCNAKAPTLGITIGGKTFWHNTEDLIYLDAASGNCYTNLFESAEAFGGVVSFLGDAFLKNVVSVFDFEKKEMRFAARVEDDHTASPSPTSTSVSSGAAGLGFTKGMWVAVAVVAASYFW